MRARSRLNRQGCGVQSRSLVHTGTLAKHPAVSDLEREEHQSDRINQTRLQPVLERPFICARFVAVDEATLIL